MLRTGLLGDRVESLGRRFNDPVAVLVHSLLLVTSMTQYAVLPLLPTLQHDLRLSAATLSLLLALPSLTMIVTAVPAGWLCDRIGPRQLTFAAGVLLTLSCILQALPGLLVFVLGRFAYGVAMTAVWTSGPAWLSESRKGSSGRVGAIVTSAAAGSIAGPLVAGALAEQFGVGLPFAVFAVAGGCLTVPLALTRRRRTAVSVRTSPRWTTLTSQLSSSRELSAAMAAMVAVGAVSGAIQLLAPLQLHRSGASAATIGLVFSASGLVYVVASACATRAGVATVTATAAVAGCLVMGVAILPAALTASSAVLVTCVLANTLPRAQLNTLSYRLAASSGAAQSGSLGVVVGLLNLVWAISMSVGPLAAAWLTSGFGIGPAFGATAVWSVGVAVLLAVMLRLRRRRTAALLVIDPAAAHAPAHDDLLGAAPPRSQSAV